MTVGIAYLAEVGLLCSHTVVHGREDDRNRPHLHGRVLFGARAAEPRGGGTITIKRPYKNIFEAGTFCHFSFGMIRWVRAVRGDFEKSGNQTASFDE
jgi:hypothetical protein